ncbi:MAG: putative Fimbrial assembly protein pilQ precursor, secretin family, partial [Pseudomonadota bacterium]
SDNQFVVEVRPQKVDPNKLVAGQGYRGERLSLNFQNIDVRALLQVIADFTNFNVITSDSVTGNVTLRLKDVPWDQALEIILQTKGLGVRKNGNVLWIAPRAEIAAREKLELESRASLESLEPVRTQAFQLNYAKASDIAAQLVGTGAAGAGASGAALGVGGGTAASSARFLSPRGSVIAEPRTNQVFVTDISSKLEDVAGLIAKLDIPQRQVLIEARIVEASDTFGRSLGVKLGSSDLRGVRGGDAGYALGSSGNRITFGGTYDAISAATGQPAAAAAGGAATGGGANANFVNLPAVGQGGYTPATFAVSLFSSAANRFLNLELSALEADGKGKLVSSPRIVTADKTKARIEQGTEFPYQQATASGATAVAFRRATLKLEVTPQITPEGNIILDLDINKDSRGETTAAGIAINTKQIKTQVLVENGGTVVIGGIFELTENDSESKVPLLGDLPVAGNLFKSRQRNTSKQEMLVFITPKMIADRGIGR